MGFNSANLQKSKLLDVNSFREAHREVVSDRCHALEISIPCTLTVRHLLRASLKRPYVPMVFLCLLSSPPSMIYCTDDNEHTFDCRKLRLYYCTFKSFIKDPKQSCKHAGFNNHKCRQHRTRNFISFNVHTHTCLNMKML